MTRDAGEQDVLKACVTVEGNHAKGKTNQRQIDEIIQIVLPELGEVDPNDIGIVSPYCDQIESLKASIGSSEVEIKTVHKSQGRGNGSWSSRRSAMKPTTLSISPNC